MRRIWHSDGRSLKLQYVALRTPKEVVAFQGETGRTNKSAVGRVADDLDGGGGQRAVARVLARLARVRQGNLGDCKPVGGWPMSELRGIRAGFIACIRTRRAPWSSCYARTTSGHKIATSGWPNSFGVEFKAKG